MSPRTAEQFEQMRNDRREAILEAALQVFAEKTFHAASVSMIAKEAGVSKGLMYNYFESKDDLLFTLLDDITEKMLERFDVRDGQPFTKGDFHRFIDVSFEFILEDPLHAKLFFSLMTQQKVAEMMMEPLLEKMAPFLGLLYQYFESQGFSPAEHWMRYFSAMIDGVQMHLILDPNFPIEPVKTLIKTHFDHAPK